MQYQTESPSSVFSCQGIVHELFGLAIKDFFSRHAFIERFDSLVQNYNDITTPPLDGTIEVHLLQLAISQDKCLVNSFAALKQTKIAAQNYHPLTYDEFFAFIQDSCLMHDNSLPLVTPS